MMCVPFYIIMSVLYHCTAVHLFPALCAFWFLEQKVLRKDQVHGTVLMIQLMRNSPVWEYIGQNPGKWKPH